MYLNLSIYQIVLFDFREQITWGVEKCTKKINDHEKIPEIEIETHLLSEDQITTRLVLYLYKATLHIAKK